MGGSRVLEQSASLYGQDVECHLQLRDGFADLGMGPTFCCSSFRIFCALATCSAASFGFCGGFGSDGVGMAFSPLYDLILYRIAGRGVRSNQ